MFISYVSLRLTVICKVVQKWSQRYLSCEFEPKKKLIKNATFPKIRLCIRQKAIWTWSVVRLKYRASVKESGLIVVRIWVISSPRFQPGTHIHFFSHSFLNHD